MALSKPKVVLQTTLPLLLTFLMLILLANQVHSKTKDTTSFQFDSFPENPTDLIYQGDVSVTPGTKHLRLTKTDASGNPQQHSVGRVLYSPPVAFWEPGRQAHFETTIVFVIRPANRDPADGLTFFIAPVDTTIPSGASGSNLGIFNSSGKGSSIFAVEFDIYPNTDGTYDPTYPHIGIDINSKYSKSFTRFEDSIGLVVTARIDYVEITRKITVHANYGSGNAELSYVFDLKTILPQQVRVGISASTGGDVATHDILKWYFTASLEWDGVNNNNTGETYIHPYV